MAVTINEGTQTQVNTTPVGGTQTQVVRVDVGSGTAASAWTGGVVVNTGTVNAGTVFSKVQGEAGGTYFDITSQSGTTNNATPGNALAVGALGYKWAGTAWDRDDYAGPSSAFATTVTSGTSTLGTIKPLVSGSAIYVTDLIVSVGSASNVTIASGGTSTPIVGTLSLAANGGMVSNFKIPLRTASGSALVFQQTANGPLSITATGYVA